MLIVVILFFVVVIVIIIIVIITLLELTIGFETKVDNNTINKATFYKHLLEELDNQYDEVTFVNLSAL